MVISLQCILEKYMISLLERVQRNFNKYTDKESKLFIKIVISRLMIQTLVF